jgi:hypothetical protein
MRRPWVFLRHLVLRELAAAPARDAQCRDCVVDGAEPVVADGLHHVGQVETRVGPARRPRLGQCVDDPVRTQQEAREQPAGVTWVHSHVSPDRRQTFCIDDAPTLESIREVATRNGLPVGCITQVSVLDPYSYGA